MADVQLRAPTVVQTPIDDNATLSDAARAAGDYDNGTNLDTHCIIYLTVQWDSAAPAVGENVAEIYILPGDGEVTEVFPEGGDAGLGSDDTPQALFRVATLYSINPSTSVDEVLASPPIALYPDGNRFVLLNVSGGTFDATWQLDIKPFRYQVS